MFARLRDVFIHWKEGEGRKQKREREKGENRKWKKYVWEREWTSEIERDSVNGCVSEREREQVR